MPKVRPGSKRSATFATRCEEAADICFDKSDYDSAIAYALEGLEATVPDKNSNVIGRLKISEATVSVHKSHISRRPALNNSVSVYPGCCHKKRDPSKRVSFLLQ